MSKNTREDEFLSQTLKSRMKEAPDAPFLEARIWNAIQSNPSATSRQRPLWRMLPRLASVLGIVIALVAIQQKNQFVTRLVSAPTPSPAATQESWESDFADGFDFFRSFDTEEELAFF